MYHIVLQKELLLLEGYEHLHKPSSFKMQKIGVILTVKSSCLHDEVERWVGVS